MPKLLRLFLLIAALFRAIPGVAAAGADPAPAGPLVFVSPDKETVYLIGVLSDGSFLKLDAALLDAPRIKRLWIASTGGLALEGRLIAALVRKRKLDTYVEYTCASACTQVFVAGRERVIGKDAELGFHQAVVIDADGQAVQVHKATGRKVSPTQIFGINANDILRLAFERAGIDPDFIARVLATNHDQIWTPTAAELLKARVVTRRASAPEFAEPPGMRSPIQIEALLSTRVLWREAARTLPAEYALASRQVWLRSNSGIELESAISSARTRLIKAIDLRSASNAQLADLLDYQSGVASAQRLQGYPLCAQASLVEAPVFNPGRLEAERGEDQVYARILANPAAVTPLDETAASAILNQEVMPAVKQALQSGLPDGKVGVCQSSYRVFEVLGAMPPDKRIRALRAIVTLPARPSD